MDEIWIEFWVKASIKERESKYAGRTTAHIPLVGDLVRFKMKIYRVTERIWFYDEAKPRVALVIEPLEGA